MRLGKLSLINLLMEEGEEDTAVLIARSALPDELDLERDAAALRALGLDADELLALLPAVGGEAGHGPRRLSAEDGAALDRAISERWAGLVANWTAPR
ncbi:hypothetical protein [Actinomadura rugatobispora]|uniref:Uncharacterized protein n=1 Tax=Actinomadura rugatobispora TaxID=1994 RepID=A0ABW1A9B6_9ACTN|nr:hypothetical protein GCM10010200_021930 [Actinomadura rugatobispora]